MLSQDICKRDNITECNNLNIPELDVYHTLNEAQLYHYFEPERGIFIAESPKVIERALNAGYEPMSLLLEKKAINAEHEALLERITEAPVYILDSVRFEEVSGLKMTRGALCAMRRKELLPVKELCKDFTRIAVLEDVENPTNVGAIIRSAAALGIDAVVLTGNAADPLYRRASRVSMGCVFQMPWTIAGDETLTELKSIGFKTVSFALTDKSVSIEDEVLQSEEKLAIILGNEGEGLKEETIATSDYTVKIPMFHGADSLNVAAAAAVAFWELRDRSKKIK